MKQMLPKMLLLAGLGLAPIANIHAQTYCVPPPFTTGPFTGIVNVSLETLDNNSPYTDGYKFFDQVSAPSLTAGQSYTISVTTEHHIQQSGFTDKLNTAAWIDWNQDGEFDETTEQVLWSDKEDPGVLTATFTVPTGAVNGETRMRIYEDMPPEDGHEVVNPCGYLNSSNGLGQHGECEDYLVNVTGGATGIADALSIVDQMDVFPNPAKGSTKLSFNLSQAADVEVAVLDIQGREVLPVAFFKSVQQIQDFTIATSRLESGIYYVSLITKQGTATKKLLVD